MDSDNIISRILAYLEHIEELTYQLIIIVAPPGAGKTALLQELSRRKNYPLINVNLQLAACLKDLSKSQRRLRADQKLAEIAAQSDNSPVLLDNTEILFDASLKLNPLALLKKISRNQIVIASWGGYVDGSRLIYAQQGHPEYGIYDTEDIIVISLD